jgi:hypothetical protein
LPSAGAGQELGPDVRLSAHQQVLYSIFYARLDFLIRYFRFQEKADLHRSFDKDKVPLCQKFINKFRENHYDRDLLGGALRSPGLAFCRGAACRALFCV